MFTIHSTHTVSLSCIQEKKGELSDEEGAVAGSKSESESEEESDGEEEKVMIALSKILAT